MLIIYCSKMLMKGHYFWMAMDIQIWCVAILSMIVKSHIPPAVLPITWNTMRCCYTAVSVLQNSHKRHHTYGVSCVGANSNSYSLILPQMHAIFFLVKKMHLKMSTTNLVAIRYRSQIVTHSMSGNASNCADQQALSTWAPSQYKDRLIYVWRFPC